MNCHGCKWLDENRKGRKKGAGYCCYVVRSKDYRSVTDFYAFTPQSVSLEGYQAHPLEDKIPVAV